METWYHSITVSEILGIGRKYTKNLNNIGIHSVMDFVMAPPLMVRDQFSIVVHRTLLELHGIACIELEHMQITKRQIISSRFCGQRIYHIDDLKEAVSLYLMEAIKRPRDEQLLCGCIILFAQSDPVDTAKPFYNKSLSLALPEPTDNLLVLSSLTLAMIEEIYTQDIGFKKCGVILTCLEPKAGQDYDIFTDMYI